MQHDCVVLPGFGAFIGNYSPSKLHPVTHLIQAPSKQLVFNRSLKTDDGLLTNALAVSMILSFGEAREVILNYCSELKHRLQNGDRVFLKGIGDFKEDVEHNLVFSPSYEINFLPEAFGLPAVQIQLISRQPIPERRPEMAFVNREIAKPEKRKFPVIKRLAQALPVIAIAAFLAVNSFLPDSNRVQISDLNFFSTSAKINKQALIGQDEVNLPEVRQHLALIEETQSFDTDNARIFLVAGCYSNESNAKGMVDYLLEKGFDAYILDRTPGGLLRVVYGDYNDVSSATEELSMIKKGFNEQAWMLIR